MNFDTTRIIYVCNLNYRTTEEELREFFKKFGTITDVEFITDKFNRPKGMAYVRFETHDMAKASLVCEETLFKDRYIYVRLNQKSAVEYRYQEKDNSQTRYKPVYVGKKSDPIKPIGQELPTAFVYVDDQGYNKSKISRPKEPNIDKSASKSITEQKEDKNEQNNSNLNENRAQSKIKETDKKSKRHSKHHHHKRRRDYSDSDSSS